MLVVDDEPSYRISLRDCLESEGFEACAVATAEDAIAMGRALVPDLLIADWMLGGERSGLDVAVDLTREFPKLRTILITGYLDAGLVVEAAGAVSRVLSKPFGIDELFAAISATLEQTGGGRVAL